MPISRDQLSAALGPKVRALNPDLAGPEALTPRPPSQADQREAALHEEILDECRSRGWKAFHGSMAHRTHRTVGEPDFIIAIEHGATLYVEAKAGQGKLSPEQQAVRAHLHKLGHTLHVVRSIHEFRALAELASDAATFHATRKFKSNG